MARFSASTRRPARSSSPAFGGADARRPRDAPARWPTRPSTPSARPSLEARAVFLETIADNILAIGDELIERAMAETGLPRGPRSRASAAAPSASCACSPSVVRDGDCPRRPHRSGACPTASRCRAPDLRLRNVAARPGRRVRRRNFPLAFSVAGGDTASALAAGCPVVVKAHPAHPGTVRAGRPGASQTAVADCGLPEGVFSLLYGAGATVGAGAGRRSAHQGGRLHRLARRRHRADEARGRARPSRSRSMPR